MASTTTSAPATRRTDPDQPGRAGPGWHWPALLVSLLAVAVVSVLGNVATDTGPDSWYAGLEQPAYEPPDWLFGPVWSVLYVLMAVSAWLVWRAGGRGRPMAIYGVQLALNLGWTWAFFAAEAPWAGVAVIVALVVAIVATIAAFRPWSTLAAGLLVPYLAWVLYATALTVGIAVLN